MEKNMNYWQGKVVRLRAIEPTDCGFFVKLSLDGEVARLCYSVPFPKSQALEKAWVEKKALHIPEDDIFDFAIENMEGDLVGKLNTHSCDSRNGTFKYGLAIAREYWGHGYATEAIEIVLRYYFMELRYQKATAHVYSFNPASIKLHERLGYQLEGRIRSMVYTEGQYHDELVFGITAEEFLSTK